MSNSWTKLGADIDGEAYGDESGYSVSLSSDGTIVAIGAPYNDGNGDSAGHVRVYNWNITPPPAGVCFPAGTPVTTDQGNIPIEKLNTHIHTIRGKSIVAITKTISIEKQIVCFEKDAFCKNVPSKKTICSPEHKILYKGKMVKARNIVDICENVHFIPYNGNILYNVLLEKEGKMIINNLICETLCPYNMIALISKISDRKEKNIKIRKVRDIIMKNDKVGYKKLYSSLLRSPNK